jgi:hypothetical protein
MKKIILFFFGAVLLSSCCLTEKDTYRYVSDDMYPVYHQYDTLIYKSNWGNKDTFIYSSLFKNYDCQSNEDYCNTEICYEALWIKYYNKNWPELDSGLRAFHELSNLGYFEFKGFSGGYSDTLLIDSVSLGGIIYKDVFYNEAKYFMKTNVLNAYYNYRYGLLQYEEKNGQVWVLQGKD